MPTIGATLEFYESGRDTETSGRHLFNVGLDAEPFVFKISKTGSRNRIEGRPEAVRFFGLEYDRSLMDLRGYLTQD